MDFDNIKNNKEITQRQRAALNTKNKLLKASMKLFSKHGYDNITVDDITDLAGVSKGTFYTHFASKESVFIEEFKRIDAYYDKKLDEAGPHISDGEKILVVIDAMTEYCANICGIEFMKVVYSSQIISPKTMPILNNKKRSLYSHLNDIVESGKTSGEFDLDLETDIIVEWLMRSARGLIYDWCLYKGTTDLEEEGHKYFTEIVKLLRHGICM